MAINKLLVGGGLCIGELLLAADAGKSFPAEEELPLLGLGLLKRFLLGQQEVVKSFLAQSAGRAPAQGRLRLAGLSGRFVVLGEEGGILAKVGLCKDQSSPRSPAECGFVAAGESLGADLCAEGCGIVL